MRVLAILAVLAAAGCRTELEKAQAKYEEGDLGAASRHAILAILEDSGKWQGYHMLDQIARRRDKSEKRRDRIPALLIEIERHLAVAEEHVLSGRDVAATGVLEEAEFLLGVLEELDCCHTRRSELSWRLHSLDSRRKRAVPTTVITPWGSGWREPPPESSR